MSCLYSSPEVISSDVFSLEILNLEILSFGLPLSCRFARCGTPYARRITVQSDSRKVLQYVAVNKDAFPNSPAYIAGCTKSFSLPKQAQISRVSFQAQYQAFVRFAVRSSAAL
jgi:hypothetical protein